MDRRTFLKRSVGVVAGVVGAVAVGVEAAPRTKPALSGKVLVSDELLADSMVDIGGYLMRPMDVDGVVRAIRRAKAEEQVTAELEAMRTRTVRYAPGVFESYKRIGWGGVAL